MKLNIGAGDTKYEGFLNCDYSDIFNPDYQFDIEKDVWPFKDNSVDEIIIHHVLEHLGEGYFHALQEMYRVCKPNAIIDIRVPHFKHQYMWHDPTHKRPITYYGLRLFSKKLNIEDNSPASKLGLHFNVDFEIIEHEEIIDDYRSNNKIIERLPSEIKDKLNDIYEETHIKWKVIK